MITTSPSDEPSAVTDSALAGENVQLQALRCGDEATFLALVREFHPAMVRVAMLYVSERSVAEEVAQEAWLGVLQGLARFEGRSSLKTWIFSIVTHIAKTRSQRERRSLPFSALVKGELESDEPAVPPERFRPEGDEYPGGWKSFPRPWNLTVEQQFLSQELMDHVQRAIDSLPPAQRTVIALRDVEGWPSQEVCNVLEIDETNQRVLLHRARAKVRRALEQYLAE